MLFYFSKRWVCLLYFETDKSCCRLVFLCFVGVLAMYVHVLVFYIILFVNIHINVHSKIFADVKQKVPYLYSFWTQTIFRSSHQRCSVKKGVLRNFTKFKGKHLRQSLFFSKVAFSYIIWLGFKNGKAELKQRVKV